MELKKKKPVPIPLSRRMSRFAQRFVPVLVWIVGVAAVCVLAVRHTDRLTVMTGIVDSGEVLVAPLADGRISGINTDIFADVAEGEIVAVMDDTHIRGELLIAESELEQLRAELGAEESGMDLPGALNDDLRRFYIDAETARLDRLDRQVAQESDRIDLERLRILMEHEREMNEKGILDALTYQQTRLEYEALRKQIQENEAAIAAANEAETAAKDRLAEFSGAGDAEKLVKQLQPFRERINVQQARVLEITDRKRQLVLTSPVTGKVARILHRTGETIRIGDPVLAIAPANASQVTAWVDESRAAGMNPGDRVEIHSPAQEQPVIVAEVLRISPRVEEIPPQAVPYATRSQWGRAAIIGNLPPDNGLIPGQTVRIRTVE